MSRNENLEVVGAAATALSLFFRDFLIMIKNKMIRIIRIIRPEIIPIKNNELSPPSFNGEELFNTTTVTFAFELLPAESVTVNVIKCLPGSK